MNASTDLSRQRQIISDALSAGYCGGLDKAAAILSNTHAAMAEAIRVAGRDDDRVIAMATDMASHTLDIVVDAVNEATRSLTGTKPADRKTRISHTLSTLADAIRILQYLSRLPVSDDFASKRLKPQADRLGMLTDRVRALSAHADSARPIMPRPEHMPGTADTAPHPHSGRHPLIWVACTVAIVICSAWTFDYYREYKQVATLSSAYAEDKAEAYLSDAGNTHYRDKVLQMYLADMGRAMHTDDGIYESSPLARMYLFASTPSLSQTESDAIRSAVRDVTDSLYTLAAAINDQEAWLTYQDLVPSMFYRDSSERLDSIDTVIWADEASAWQAAIDADDRNVYRRYMVMYPNGRHSADADGRLVDIEVNDYRNRSGLSPIDSISRISAYQPGRSSVHILNQSEYPVQFLFSGPTSRRMQISPSQTSVAELADGAYRVLVLIDNERSDRFSFEQTFDSGLYSSSISYGNE